MTKADIIEIIINTIDNEIYELKLNDKIASFVESTSINSNIDSLNKLKQDLCYYVNKEIKIERKDETTL